jgi:hypothetical protein
VERAAVDTHKRGDADDPIVSWGKTDSFFVRAEHVILEFSAQVERLLLLRSVDGRTGAEVHVE